jgi:hypothetical protein
MKKLRLLIIAAMLVAVTTLHAQEAPRKGAILKSDQNTLVIKADQEIEANITLLRSKMERKRKFGTPVIQNIDGLVATVTPVEGTPDTYVLNLKATSITPGNYNLIVKGGGNNKHLITGTMLSLVVEGTTALSSSN